MIVLQTIAVAFAMFSAIPVPQFDWNEKNMRYAMCAFPLIGVVIGAAWCVCGAMPLPGLAKAAGFALIPVWITGGIHLDGYADTCDALSSYGDREKKLEILKDPHCGAFAVLRLCSYFAAYLALCRELKKRTDEDLQNNVIARFHDESQLNRLVAETPGKFRILPPDYCTPEETPTGHEAILVLQKSRCINVESVKGAAKPQNFVQRKWEAFRLNWLPYLWRATRCCAAALILKTIYEPYQKTDN